MVGVLNGKKKVVSIVVVAFLLCGVFGGLVTEQSVAVDYSLWRYYKVLTVTNSSALLSGYQVNFTVWSGVGTDYVDNFYLNNHGSELYADLRFVDGDGNLLDMWNESSLSGGHVHVWLELVTSRVVVMYYGNSLASGVWGSASSVFTLIDGVTFDGNFTSGSGTTLEDISGNNNDGSITGAVWRGNSLMFDGSNDYVSISAGSFYGNTSITAVWLGYAVNSTGGTMYVFSRYFSDYYMAEAYINSAGKYSWKCGNGVASSVVQPASPLVTVNNYSDMVVSWNGSYLKERVNGSVIGETALATSVNSGAGNLFLGSRGGTTGWFNGTVSCVVMFNDTLTNAEAYALTNSSNYGFGHGWVSGSLAMYMVSGSVSVGSASQVDTSEVDVAQSEWLGVGVSFGLIAVSLLLALKSRSWAVNFLLGLSLVGFLGWEFANATTELFGGWLDFMVLVGAVLVLVKGAVLVRASGV